MSMPQSVPKKSKKEADKEYRNNVIFFAGAVLAIRAAPYVLNALAPFFAAEPEPDLFMESFQGDSELDLGADVLGLAGSDVLDTVDSK